MHTITTYARKIPIDRFITSFYYIVLGVFLIPSINLGVFYSYKLGKIGILGLFGLLIVHLCITRQTIKIGHLPAVAILTYITSLVLSAFHVLDVSKYLVEIRDVLLVLMVYVISIYVIQTDTKHTQKFITIILSATIINLAIKFFIFFYPELLNSLLTTILNPDYIRTISVNLARNRIYFESYDEIFIPLLISFFVSQKKYKKALSAFLVIAITATSFISNFRSKFLILFFACIGSCSMHVQKHRWTTIGFGLSIIATIAITTGIILNQAGFSLIDRFLLENKQEDIVSITRRGDLFWDGIDMGLIHPLTGIGLNQFDYYTESISYPLTSNPDIYYHRDLLADDRRPHDIVSFTFAETGFIGIFALLLLYYSFIKNDQDILQSGDKYKKSLVVSFWSLVVFSLLNPAVNFSYLFLFWLLRAEVQRISATVNSRK